MKKTFPIVSLVALAMTALGPAQAQQPQNGNGLPDLDIEIGAAAGFTSAYEGSSSVSATGFPLITLHHMRIPGLFSIGGGPDRGLSFSPSFRIVSARNALDDIRLFGLGNIGTAVEVGMKVAYRWEYVRVFAALRKGFGGHTGWTGDIGADFISRLAPRWTLEAGPRLEFASASYMSKYFSITALQSAFSGYPVYNAGGGIKGAGVEAQLRYQINEKWAAIGKAKYIRLTGDAGKAPLVRAGSANAFSASVGLTYRFTTNFSGR